MKRFILLIALIAMNMPMLIAQKIAIMPKIGINRSTMANQKLAISSDYTQFERSNAVVKAIVGFDFYYALSNKTALISGFSYNQRGCAFDDIGEATADISKNSIKLDYLDIPVMLQLKLVDELCVHSGLVFGVLLKAKHNQDNLRSTCNKVNYSLPLGISYEWQHLVFDVTYEHGVNKVYHEGEIRHRNILISLGYKFNFK